MGYHNIFAQQQLLEVHNELVDELSAIRSAKEDDELDQELKRGMRGALELSIGIINNRLKKLRNEQK